MLDKEFIEERKKDLLLQKERLEGELSKIATKSNGEYKTKFPDYGSEEEDSELEVEMYVEGLDAESQIKKLLDDTNKALKNIEEGKYGFCENCQKEIDRARLEAHPAAQTCIKCK